MPGEADEMADLASMMKQDLNAEPKLLSRSAGKSECCIFRVPPGLVKINKKALYPHVVSIGPYHRGEEQLKMLEEHKRRFLSSLLARCEPHGIHLQELIDAVFPEEERIRESYSECIDKFSRSELVKMMVLDGCFIIEFLAIVKNVVQASSDEPIFKVPWIQGALLLDLLQLENQIPYFVLRKLFEITRASWGGGTTLAGLALYFFNASVQRPSHIIDDYSIHITNQTDPVKHLLDLYWTSFVIPISDSDAYARNGRPRPPLELNQSTQMLRKAGVKLQRKKSAKSFLEISFNKGTLEIPLFKLGDYNHCLLLNFVAFEQCYGHCPQYMTSYATLMGCLIKSSIDAEYLQNKQIIENFIGTQEEVASLFNQIYKSVVFDVEKSYLAIVFEGVNSYSSSKWRVRWNGIKHKYFGAPWAWIAALGALLGLLLTAAQTVFTLLSYLNPPSE